MTLLTKIPFILIAILIPVVVFVFCNFYFNNAFDRYQVWGAFDEKYSQDKLKTEFSSILDYLKPLSTTQLNQEFFSYEDIAHMQDVRNLYSFVYIILVVSVVLGVIVRVRVRDRLAILTHTRPRTYLIFGLALLTLLAIVALNFDSFFELFHKLLFPNNTYWSLDPNTSNLIKFLPVEIFKELGLLWVTLTLLVFIIEAVIKRVLLLRR